MDDLEGGRTRIARPAKVLELCELRCNGLAWLWWLGICWVAGRCSLAGTKVVGLLS